MKTQIKGCLLLFLFSVFAVGVQGAQVEEDPGAFTMVGDLLVARPIGLALLAMGSLTYLVTLPFSVAGGNADEAAKVLVIGPAREVFVRCLGCRRPGRKEKITASRL